MSRPDALQMYFGFRAEINDRSRVADWVDAEVMSRGVASGPLLELGLLRDKSDKDIEASLLLLAEEKHGAAIAERGLVVLSTMVRAGEHPVCSFRWALPSGWFSSYEIEHLDALDDAYYVACRSQGGTVEEVEAQLLAVMRQRPPAASSPPTLKLARELD